MLQIISSMEQDLGFPKCAFRSDEELRFLNLMRINGS
jgi:hypothetical protein